MGANKPADLTPLAAQWLRDYNEAPWRRYLRALEERGLLADVDEIRVDAGALFKTRFRCDTRTCAAIDRRRGTESCCTDYDVEITPEERSRIVEHAGAVIELLSRHDGRRVTPGRDIAEFFEESHSISLAKEKRRCAFSYRDGAGDLRCGLHSLALEKGVPVTSIKPLACVLFPIVIYRFENGEVLLTATSRETSSLFGREKDSELPCLRVEQGDPMFIECRMAIEAGFGEAFYQRLVVAAREFAQATPGPA
jgi:Protein of unknown function (DUF3109)